MNTLHKLMHKLNLYNGRVVSRLNGCGQVEIGFQCDKCGRIDDWHVSKLADIEIEKRRKKVAQQGEEE